MKMRWMVRVGRVLMIVCVVAAALGFIVMGLWNALVPALFGGPVLGYWQALGLLLLTRILFSGGGPGRFGGWRRDRWRKRFEERMASMSPEERERFKSEWGARCGPSRGRWGAGAGEAAGAQPS